MKYNELPEEMQKGLLKGTRKTLIISTIILCSFFFGIALFFASFGHNMWVVGIFPALVGIMGLINLWLELRQPHNALDRSLMSAEYSFNKSALEGNEDNKVSEDKEEKDTV